MTSDATADGPRLSTTYDDARSAAHAAARRADATTTTSVHPSTGRDGEELAIDVVTIGPDDAEAVLVIVSGTHGVEGYAGSALQRWWLDERAHTIPPGVRVAIVHALNPVGFSWVRRVNEDNVDLNRNFVDWTSPPQNDAYGDLADLLVPTAWDEETQAATTTALLEIAGDVGFPRFQEIISGGQYDHPTGVFHGGSGPAWSNRWITERMANLVGSARRLGVIDVHTGLGPWGHGELISHESAGDPGYDRGTAWWGEVRSMADGESVSAQLSGDWLGAIDGWVPDVEVTAAALEFGTVDTVTVLQALRADAWLHAHGDPRGPDGDVIRAQVRAAFADDDPAWLATLVERFDAVSSAALIALAAGN
ncbi:DUF2817 domain-containing protein [Ilumatobacter sp.]|uniref:DUF2817 domain-containing protein n=1 Tax=Ilumatobacter sp. TaxID=1967498 RepID=UPI003C4FF447